MKTAISLHSSAPGLLPSSPPQTVRYKIRGISYQEALALPPNHSPTQSHVPQDPRLTASCFRRSRFEDSPGGSPAHQPCPVLWPCCSAQQAAGGTSGIVVDSPAFCAPQPSEDLSDGRRIGPSGWGASGGGGRCNWVHWFPVERI